ncbi:MAG: hypothetical protein R2727_05820 [Bacteroidales bacterium]
MLFWIENAEYRHIVQSAVNVAINNAINNAGITIPFPQHDLHLKTIDRRDYRSVPEIIITSLRIDIGSPGFSLCSLWKGLRETGINIRSYFHIDR